MLSIFALPLFIYPLLSPLLSSPLLLCSPILRLFSPLLLSYPPFLLFFSLILSSPILSFLLFFLLDTMPEARDRLSRPLDIASIFARRRANILGILDDSEELESALYGGVRFGSPRTGINRGRTRGLRVYRPPATGAENTPPRGIVRRGRARRSRSHLPSWYPRSPLRDITAITRVSIIFCSFFLCSSISCHSWLTMLLLNLYT